MITTSRISSGPRPGAAKKHLGSAGGVSQYGTTPQCTTGATGGAGVGEGVGKGQVAGELPARHARSSCWPQPMSFPEQPECPQYRVTAAPNPILLTFATVQVELVPTAGSRAPGLALVHVAIYL